MTRKRAALLPLFLIAPVFVAIFYWSLQSPTAVLTSDSPSHLEVIDRFYAAMNLALRTGETRELRDVLSGSFVDRPATGGNERDREAFIGQVTRLGELFPGLVLEPGEIRGTGDFVFVSLKQSDSPVVELARLPISATAAWGSFDLFQFQGNRIQRHWGAAAEGFAFDRWPSLEFPVQEISRWSIDLVRQTFPSKTERTLDATKAPIFIRVTEGEFGLTISTQGETAPTRLSEAEFSMPSELSERRTVVLTGDAITLPVGTVATLSNPELDASQAVIFAIHAPVVVAPGDGEVTNEGSNGISTEVIAFAPARTLQPGDYEVEIALLDLPAGFVIPAHEHANDQLIVIESGSLMVSAERPFWITSPGAHAAGRRNAASLSSGAGASLEAGGQLSMVTGPDGITAISVFTLRPAS